MNPHSGSPPVSIFHFSTKFRCKTAQSKVQSPTRGLNCFLGQCREEVLLPYVQSSPLHCCLSNCNTLRRLAFLIQQTKLTHFSLEIIARNTKVPRVQPGLPRDPSHTIPSHTMCMQSPIHFTFAADQTHSGFISAARQCARIAGGSCATDRKSLDPIHCGLDAHFPAGFVRFSADQGDAGT